MSRCPPETHGAVEQAEPCFGKDCNGSSGLPQPGLMRYRAAMSSDTSLTIAKRPESKLQHCWGIYSPLKDQWLDVVFRTEREAEKVLKAMLLSAREQDQAQRIRGTSSSR